MNSATRAKRLFEEQFSGYLLAVTGAAATASILSLVSIYLSAPDPSRLWESAFLIVFTGFWFWIFAFLGAIIPFMATIKVAARFRITNVFYFIVFGALTGILVSPAIIYFTLKWYGWYRTSPGQPWLPREVVDAWRLTVPAGMVGALLHWWKVGRHQDRS